MRIDDLLAAPHPKYGSTFGKSLKDRGPYRRSPWIGMGEASTRRETHCLLTHVLITDCRAVIPASWHDAIGLALLQLWERGEISWNPGLVVTRMAGPRTIIDVKNRLREGRIDDSILFNLLEPLLAEDWALNLPLFGEALYVSRGFNSYLKPQVETRLEEFRKQQAIAPDTWELLMIPQSQFASERIEKSRAKWAVAIPGARCRGR